jgi:hypothetical protein
VGQARGTVDAAQAQARVAGLSSSLQAVSQRLQARPRE